MKKELDRVEGAEFEVALLMSQIKRECTETGGVLLDRLVNVLLEQLDEISATLQDALLVQTPLNEK